jgi:hypothetical protein
MRWFVTRAGKTVGPVEDAQLAEWARQGRIEPGTFICDERGGAWTPFEQSPFAQLHRAQAMKVRPLGAIAVVSVGVFGVWMSTWDACSKKSSSTATTVTTSTNSPNPQRPPPPSPNPVVLGPSGGWATVRRPGRELSNTANDRLKYMSNVLQAHAGEPPLKKAAARPIVDRLRKELAKAAGVSAARIKATVGDTAASMFIDDGVMGRVGKDESDAIEVGVCSEIYLANAILGIPGNKEAFADAGIRAVMCTSKDCSALFDMRPTATGGGFYHGEACVSLGDLVEMATQK